MPPKKAKKIVKTKASKAAFTVRPHSITGMGVKVHNKTGRIWEIDPITGKGFFSDAWRWVKKGVGWLKDNKVISTVAKLIPHQLVGTVAGQVGFGRAHIVPFLPSSMVR